MTSRDLPGAVHSAPNDVPGVLDLVERTKPGPLFPGTIELGRYLGIRRRGRLVAMAGERLDNPGWTEVSAVCTDLAHRRQALVTDPVLAAAAGIGARSERPLLHAVATNTGAIRLNQQLGLVGRRHTTFGRLRAPGSPHDLT